MSERPLGLERERVNKRAVIYSPRQFSGSSYIFLEAKRVTFRSGAHIKRLAKSKEQFVVVENNL